MLLLINNPEAVAWLEENPPQHSDNLCRPFALKLIADGDTSLCGAIALLTVVPMQELYDWGKDWRVLY